LQKTNYQLYQANTELRSLRNISEVLNSSLDLPMILQQSLNIISRTLPVDYCLIWITKHDSDNLYLAASNLPDHIDYPREMPADQDLAAEAFQREGPVFVEEGGKGLRCGDWEWNQQLGCISQMVYPILHGQRRLGLIMVANKTVREFDERTKTLWTTYMNTVSLAIRNAHLYERVLEQTIRDDLTGLYNFRYLMQRLEEELQRAARKKSFLSLLMFDLDDFKKFNDAYGHLEGNKVLAGIGEIFKANTRSIDLASRFGGEEFALLLQDVDADQARQVAERIMASLRNKPYLSPKGGKVFLTFSVGIATYPIHAKTGQELLQKADQMLYKAKGQKNRIEVYSESKAGS
ncbi:MAG: sensor domain-containing diguanylate cyclase, partial [Clostridia bacterium]|nr:sensor domain-containing diguanylate cyclase [Clostridia bacterium]